MTRVHSSGGEKLVIQITDYQGRTMEIEHDGNGALRVRGAREIRATFGVASGENCSAVEVLAQSPGTAGDLQVTALLPGHVSTSRDAQASIVVDLQPDGRLVAHAQDGIGCWRTRTHLAEA